MTVHQAPIAGRTTEPGRETFHAEYTRNRPWPPSTEIVLAIASATGVEPTSMLPLNAAVDPDALNRHIDHSRVRDAELSFEFHGYRITVRSDGHLTFVPLGEREASAGEDAHAASG